MASKLVLVIVFLFDLIAFALAVATEHRRSTGVAMTVESEMTAESEIPARLEGEFKAMAICWILGLGSLVPWNSMVIIGDYYTNLFTKYHPTRAFTLVSQSLGVITMAILAYNESKIDTRKRNLAGFILFFAITLSLLLLDLGTSGKGGIGPFLGTCAIVACCGVAIALVEGGMVGDLSFMCPEFIQSYVAGQAAAGALTSALRLLTKAIFEKSHDGLRKGAEDSTKHERLSTKQLFFQNIDYALGLFLIYVLTLFIFPGFLYENTGEHKLGSWYALVLIATFHMWDLISRYIPLVDCLKLESRKWLMIVILSRFLLIPAFYFTAKYGDQGWMIMLTSFLGLTNGYVTVCVFTSAPKGYKLYLKDEMKVTTYDAVYDGKPLSASIPKRSTCTIKEVHASRYTRALLDNGLTILVPSYLESGEVIFVNTEDDSYIGRAK
ncbi:hypothetical protein LWI29_010271 [Acer saccharum]|uniref:Elongation factor P C-terminal domain-containing protein n=1 Tax=Acer saccharum TaxID=4024 RepID=A0AA39RIS0_ACESA|nr:hypothetical protein LWI29_010271 [Acer saccharum]